MFSFFQNAFSQTLSSTFSKSRYMPRILMRKYIDCTDFWIVVGFHVQIAIGDNRGNRIFISHAT